MTRFRFVRSLGLVLATLAALSCSESSPSAPPAQTTADDALSWGRPGTLPGPFDSFIKVIPGVVDPTGIDVRAVRWAPTHVNEIRSVSGTIGFGGGSLSIPGSDFTITFPSGALLTPTAITITSDASGYVSYDMQPHGLIFAKPVTVTQRLSNTAIYGTSEAWNSFGAFLLTDPLDLSGIIKAVETTTTTILAPPVPPGAAPEVQLWQILHFSRYILASG
jgi:hypothetical protein